MKEPAILELFNQFVDSKIGVQKLKSAIHSFAIQGKLTEQKTTDKPASNFVEKIDETRKYLVKSGDLRERKHALSIDSVDGPFLLPAGWQWRYFGDIVYNRDGERIPVSKSDRAERQGEYDYYGASGVIDKIDDYIFDKPLLLIGEDGANLINRSTPIAFIANGKYWVNNHAHVLDGVSLSFLRYVELFINAVDLKPYVTGTAQPKMNQAKMNSIPVALPPENEQKRIVAKVEELMGLCDELEAARAERERQRTRLNAASLHQLATAPDDKTLREAARFHFSILPKVTIHPDQIPPLRQTILDLAVRGKLVEQDERESPSDDRFSKYNKKRLLKWANPIVEVEFPFEPPKHWEWVRLGEVAQIKHGFAFKSEFFTKDQQPYILATPGSFYESGGFRDIESKRKYYSGPIDPEYVLKAGDFIIPMTEQAAGLLGSPAIVPDNDFIYLHNQRLGKMTFANAVLPAFMYWFFNCAFFRRELRRTSTGAKVKHTSPDRVLSVPTPLAPFEEQKRIVVKVDELMALCDDLEASLTRTQTESRRLLGAIMAEISNDQHKL